MSFETSRHVAFITGAVGDADLRALAEAVANPLRERLEEV